MRKDRDLVQIAFYAALTAALGLLPPIAIPFLAGVPISAQTLGVMLAGVMLGPVRGGLAMLLFLFAVALGLPILSGGRGGLGVFAGPTVGFLVGFPVGAIVAGLAMKALKSWPVFAAALISAIVGGVLAVYALGIPALAYVANLTLPEAAVGAMVYLPGDIVKAVVAAAVAQTIARGLPSALLSRSR